MHHANPASSTVRVGLLLRDQQPSRAHADRVDVSISSSVEPQGISSDLLKVAHASWRISAATRSGYVAAKGMAMKPQSPVAKIAGRSDPASSSTARRSSTSVSRGGMSAGVKRSEHPRPRRSVTIRREKRESARAKRANAGCSQLRTTFESWPWR
jgi:hypothetical protein